MASCCRADPAWVQMTNLVGDGFGKAVDPQRIKEMQQINKSLLVLGNVIAALTSAFCQMLSLSALLWEFLQ